MRIIDDLTPAPTILVIAVVWGVPWLALLLPGVWLLMTGSGVFVAACLAVLATCSLVVVSRNEVASYTRAVVIGCGASLPSAVALDSSNHHQQCALVRERRRSVSTDPLREHLLWLLRGGQAHVCFESAVDDLAVECRGRRAPGMPHSPWQLLEHMRIAQRDILEFSRRADHVSPEFPDGYWPETDGPPDAGAWDASVAAFVRDAEALQGMVADPERDLFAPFDWGDGQTLLCEVLLVADHNAYHLGQLVAVRKALGAWSE